MGVSEGDPVAVEEAEMHTEDDLAVTVALRLVGPANRLETLSLDKVGDEYAARR